ncbi:MULTISPECIES: XRE family transcriptional regulator [Nocardia]|uniref:XRE family transcriptional regulator n=2 Tax=Nocardia TaxID=1817 RepID=A0A6G9YIT5_9NOCA|nr:MULTISPECIES: XRE family transcriptional regulator [Nocardia]QIS13215.1 XRE family transcriptional regulator [Nocardia arthritidis]
MRSERDARGWSQADAVRVMRAKSSHNLPTDSTLLRNWRRWESGESRPDDFYAPIIAAAFDTVTAAFFPKARPNRDDELLSATGMDTLEFIGRLRMSDVSAATLDAIRITAERLCCEYPIADPHELHTEGTAWLRRITSLLDGRLTLSQHREILVLAGWVALLVGCVDYDIGRRTTAEATRRAAHSLGLEAENPEITGWAAEMAAWFALTQGNYRGAIEAVDSAIDTSRQLGVGVQLSAQRAKALARLGERKEVENALGEGRAILERLDHPANLDNHFVVDPQKFDFYAMDCCRVAGEDRLAESYAREVIRNSTRADGTVRNPMRVSEAHLTLAVVAVRNRDLELAVDEGMRAFAGKRRSLPSLMWIAGETAREIIERFPGDPRTRIYLDQLRSLSAE